MNERKEIQNDSNTSRYAKYCVRVTKMSINLLLCMEKSKFVALN